MPDWFEEDVHRVAPARYHGPHNRVAHTGVVSMLTRLVMTCRYLASTASGSGRVLGGRCGDGNAVEWSRLLLLLVSLRPGVRPRARLRSSSICREDALLHAPLAAFTGPPGRPAVVHLAPALALSARDARLVGSVVALGPHGLSAVSYRHGGDREDAPKRWEIPLVAVLAVVGVGRRRDRRLVALFFFFSFLFLSSGSGRGRAGAGMSGNR